MEREIATEFEIDGKKITVFKGKAKDLVSAQMMTNGNPFEMIFALFALLVEIDGKRLTKEDYEEMPLEEFVALQERVLPFLGLSQKTLQPASSFSQNSQDLSLQNS